jgi:hypothetical protein
VNVLSLRRQSNTTEEHMIAITEEMKAVHHKKIEEVAGYPIDAPLHEALEAALALAEPAADAEAYDDATEATEAAPEPASNTTE